MSHALWYNPDQIFLRKKYNQQTNHYPTGYVRPGSGRSIEDEEGGGIPGQAKFLRGQRERNIMNNYRRRGRGRGRVRAVVPPRQQTQPTTARTRVRVRGSRRVTAAVAPRVVAPTTRDARLAARQARIQQQQEEDEVPLNRQEEINQRVQEATAYVSRHCGNVVEGNEARVILPRHPANSSLHHSVYGPYTGSVVGVAERTNATNPFNFQGENRVPIMSPVIGPLNENQQPPPPPPSVDPYPALYNDRIHPDDDPVVANEIEYNSPIDTTTYFDMWPGIVSFRQPSYITSNDATEEDQVDYNSISYATNDQMRALIQTARAISKHMQTYYPEVRELLSFDRFLHLISTRLVTPMNLTEEAMIAAMFLTIARSTLMNLSFNGRNIAHTNERRDADVIQNTLYNEIPPIDVRLTGHGNSQIIGTDLHNVTKNIIQAIVDIMRDVYFDLDLLDAGQPVDAGFGADYNGITYNDLMSSNVNQQLFEEYTQEMASRAIQNLYLNNVRPTLYQRIPFNRTMITPHDIYGIPQTEAVQPPRPWPDHSENYQERVPESTTGKFFRTLTTSDSNTNIFSFTFLVELEKPDQLDHSIFKKTCQICLGSSDAYLLRQWGDSWVTNPVRSNTPSDRLKRLIENLIMKRLYDNNVIGPSGYYDGDLYQIIVFFEANKIYDYKNAKYLGEIQMQGIRLKSSILESLNTEMPQLNHIEGKQCVLEYLYENVKKFRSRVSVNDIAEQMSKITNIDQGINVMNIKEWITTYYPQFSMYSICEGDGTVFEKQKSTISSNTHNTRMLAFVVSNNHLYPITHPRIRNKISRNIRIDIFDKYQISITETPLYIENATGEETDIENNVIATKRDMEPFLLECIRKSGYLIDQIQINEHEITMFRSPLNKKIYVNCKNWDEISTCCQKCCEKFGNSFDFLPHGQSLSCISRCIFNITIGNMKSISSYYSHEMRNIFENYHQTSIVLSLPGVLSSHGNQKQITWQLDKNSCYREAAYMNTCSFPIFTALDCPTKYNGKVIDGNLYLTKSIEIPVGNGEYIKYPSTIWAANQIEILKDIVNLKEDDIICELPCRKKLESSFLKPFFDVTNKLFDKPIRKKIDNFMIGLLNHKTGRKENGMLTNDVDYTVSLCNYLSNSNKNYDVSIKKIEGVNENMHDILMIRMYKIWKLKYDCSPIWNVILGNAIISLIKKIKQFISRNSNIIAIKTDAIVFDNKPISNQLCQCVFIGECCQSCMNLYEMGGWKWKYEQVIIPIQKNLCERSDYNFVQNEWIKENVSFENRLKLKQLEHSALITGEAGSGKTTLAVDLIENFQNNKIVVLSYMNSAIQNIRNLLTTRNIKFDSKYRSWKNGDVNILCSTTHSFFASLNSKNKDKDDEKEEEDNDIVMSEQKNNEDEQKQIILTEEQITQNSLDSNIICEQENFKIDYVLVDEISMIPSNIIWKLYRLWKKYECKIILFGDFNQIPPVEDLVYYYPDVLMFRELCNNRWFHLDYISECGRYTKELFDVLEEFKQTKKLPGILKCNSIAIDTFPKNYNIIFTNSMRDHILSFHPRGQICIGNEVICEMSGNEQEKIRLKDKYGIFQSEFYNVLDIDKNTKQIAIETIKGNTWVPSNFFLSTAAITSHKYQGRTIREPYNIYNLPHERTVSFNSMYTALSRGTKLEDVHCIYTDQLFRGIDYSSCWFVHPAKLIPLHQYKKDNIYHIQPHMPPDVQSEGLWWDCEEHKIKQLLQFLNKTQYSTITIPEVEMENEKRININTRFNKTLNAYEVDCHIFGTHIKKTCKNHQKLLEVQTEIRIKAEELNFVKKHVGTYSIPKTFNTHVWKEDEDNNDEFDVVNDNASKYFQTVIPKSIPFGHWYYQMYPSLFLKGKAVMVHEPMKNKDSGRRAYTCMPWNTLIKIKESMLERKCNQYDYEILLKNTRLFCDIDCDTKLQFGEETLLIRDFLNQMICDISNFDITNIRILHSQGTKTSFHIIYLDEIFEHITFQKKFWIDFKINFEKRNIIYSNANKNKGVLDLSVYTKNRCLRNIYSTKPGKHNELLPVDINLNIIFPVNMLEYFVETSFVDCYSQYSSTKKKIKANKFNKKINRNIMQGTAPRFLKTMMFQYNQYLPGLDIEGMKFNGSTFMLPRVQPGMCFACQRPHDRQNAFIYCAMSKYYFVCFADTSKKIELC